MMTRAVNRKAVFRGRIASRRLSRALSRRGAAVVELAILAPVLAILLLGICEVGQAMRVESVLATAARSACSIASSPSGSNSSATAEATNLLEDAHLPADDVIVTILINDAAGEVSEAVKNDKITVTVKLPTSATRTLAANYYTSANSYHIETVTMLRQ